MVRKLLVLGKERIKAMTKSGNITQDTLNAYVDGVVTERERVIELLSIWDCNNDRCDCDSINECAYRQELIAVIKGEK